MLNTFKSRMRIIGDAIDQRVGVIPGGDPHRDLKRTNRETERAFQRVVRDDQRAVRDGLFDQPDPSLYFFGGTRGAEES